MNPRHLEFVVAVAEHESFSRAAEAVHVSQPSLSHAISTIEERVGSRLFRRAGRAVSVTPAGEAFVECARVVLRDLAVLEASVKSVEGLETGTLDLAVPHASAADLMARLVGEFRSRHRGVKVRIFTSENPHNIERYVRTGHCELALAVEPVDPPLESQPVGKEESLAVFPPGTRLKRRPVRHGDLVSFPMIVPSGSYRYYGMMLDVIPGKAPFVAVETESRQALIPLVLAGAGFTFLPRALAEGARRQGLVVAPLIPPLKRDIRLVRRPGPLSPAAQVFADLASCRSWACVSGCAWRWESQLDNRCAVLARSRVSRRPFRSVSRPGLRKQTVFRSA